MRKFGKMLNVLVCMIMIATAFSVVGAGSVSGQPPWVPGTWQWRPSTVVGMAPGHDALSVDSASPLTTYQVGPFPQYSLPGGDILGYFHLIAPDGSVTTFPGPMTRMPAGMPGNGLGLTAPVDVDALSDGRDMWWPAWPMTVTFSVDRNAVGRQTTGLRPPGWPSQHSDVYTEAQNGEASGDLFVSGAWIGALTWPTGPNRLAFRTPGWNWQAADEDGVPTPPYLPASNLYLSQTDDIDAYTASFSSDPELRGTPGAVTLGPQWGPVLAGNVTGGPVFYSVDPTTATLLTASSGVLVNPGDILASANGNWWVYATAANLGLTSTDDIDALALYISPYTIQPGMTITTPGFGHNILFSLSPSSPTVGTICPATGRTITEGDILTTGGFMGNPGQPSIFIPGTGLGLTPTDNLNALYPQPGLELTINDLRNLTRRPHGRQPWDKTPPPPPHCRRKPRRCVPPPPGPQPMIPSPMFRLPPVYGEPGPIGGAELMPYELMEEHEVLLLPDATLLNGVSDWKKSIAPEIESILPLVTPEAQEKLNEVISYVEASLSEDLWLDNTLLNMDYGEEVFNAEIAAVEILTELAENPWLYGIDPTVDIEVMETILGTINTLWKADCALAETVYIFAVLLDCDEDAIGIIEEKMIDGHESIDSDLWAQACKDFRDAWCAAMDAIEALILVEAIVDIDPDTLNLKSKGRWITAYIEPTEGYDANEIDVTTVEICEINGNPVHLPAKGHPIQIGDHDKNGIPDLKVKFDRAEVGDVVGPGEAIITVAGDLPEGMVLEGSDIINVKIPP